MTIRLLGTGAAEGVPALVGASRVSLHARQDRGRELRTRSGALVDGHLKVDFPPDTLAQLHRDGLDAGDWSALFFTHSHDDHFALEELQYGLYPFCDDEALGFTIFGNSTVEALIRERYPEWPMDVRRTRSFEPVSWAGYTVTPIAARHKEDEDAHNLLFQDGRATILYATDTGYWREETWEFLKGFRLDALAMECNSGVAQTDYLGHHTLDSFLSAVGRLREEGILREGATVASTHHSHNGDLTYAELTEILEPKGILAGYDGLEIEA
jgi:phosphoribosyl 1,2-cyclic phosphate phosphodiesterase